MTKRKFQMHEKLLLDVIKRQAGTIQKAVLEGVMNSIEAGASKVEVNVQLGSISIKDDGRGFRNAEEVEKWFATFGQPHDKSEGKKWAQFRMGRGQLFAFGRNSWRTGRFRMSVDINERLGYDLEENLDEAKGCSISVMLYDPITEREQYGVLREVAKYVKYVSIPVIVNGNQVNEPPESKTWGKESCDDAYIRLNDGERGLDVYNLGVYVKTFWKGEFGTSGVVVSKERLDVNFARNDVIKSCPVWRRIRNVVDKCEKVKKVRRKTNLSDSERVALIDKLCSGEIDGDEAKKVRFFVDVSGHSWSPDMIDKANFPQWSYAKRNDRRGDKLIQQGQCLVLDEECIRAFHCMPENIFKKLCPLRRQTQFVPFEEAAGGINESSVPLPESQWTPNEAAWVRIAEKMTDMLVPYRQYNENWKEHANRWLGRKIVVGLSDVADGWTDGRTFIALNRNFLRNLILAEQMRPNMYNISKVASLMLHELVHDGDSTKASHGVEFYKTFHDLVSEGRLAGAVESIMRWLTPHQIEVVKRTSLERIRRAKKNANKVAASVKAPAKKKKPTKAPAKKKPNGNGPTAGQLEKKVLKAIYEARQEGLSWSKLEEKFGLRKSNGMTAVHAVKRWEKINGQ